MFPVNIVFAVTWILPFYMYARIHWYSVESSPWQLLCYDLFGMWNFISPEVEEAVMSYWPGDIGDESLIAAESYKKKCAKRVSSVLDLVKFVMVVSVEMITCLLCQFRVSFS